MGEEMTLKLSSATAASVFFWGEITELWTHAHMHALNEDNSVLHHLNEISGKMQGDIIALHFSWHFTQSNTEPWAVRLTLFVLYTQLGQTHIYCWDSLLNCLRSHITEALCIAGNCRRDWHRWFIANLPMNITAVSHSILFKSKLLSLLLYLDQPLSNII